MMEHLFREGYFSALDFHFAGTLGRLAGESDPLALLAAAVASRETAQGHICADIEKMAGQPVIDISGGLITGCQWPEKTAWLRALKKSPLVAQEETTAPLVMDSAQRLYLARYWQYQQALVYQLRDRSFGTGPPVDDPLLAAGLARLFPPDSHIPGPDLQRVAAEKSVRHYLTVVSGGPGTGKTTTVIRMLALIVAQALAADGRPPRIRLAAPTGKAAARLGEAIAAAKHTPGMFESERDKLLRDAIPEETVTIHRLLGSMGRTSPNRFRHDAGRLLPLDVLVVDESSMVDLALMTRLVAAVPRDARLILLGDKDQLASVEAGAILGDICHGIPGMTATDQSGPAGIGRCIVHLTHSYRFSSESGIGCLSKAINAGNTHETLACLKDPASPSVSLIDTGSPDKLDEILSGFVRTHYLPCMKEKDPARRLARLAEFRVLCGHRQGPAGVESVNRMVGEILHRESQINAYREWYDGRPIMITRNDYQLGLFNGDMGVICASPDDPAALVSIFAGSDGRLRTISPSRLPAHETVFAMTTHKSQGAEFDHVLLVLPPRRSPVITRELLYTAVTRARKGVTILGPASVIREAVRTPVQRASGLSEQLWG